MLADTALTTLDRMKLMLGLSDIEDERTDEIVTLLINRASSWIERQIGRHLGMDYKKAASVFNYAKKKMRKGWKIRNEF